MTRRARDRAADWRRRVARLATGALLLAAAGCETVRANLLGAPSSAPAAGTPGFVQGFLGAAVADEPSAALAARDVLSAGGSAADAAVATAFMLAVTLPSRAGLGGGGNCLAYQAGTKGPGAGLAEAVLFAAPAASAPGGDRPAAVPMLARGMFALHARYGRRPIEELIVRAEQTARFGTPISRALARDIAVVAAPLSGDPAAASVFLTEGASPPDGTVMRQPDLGASLAQLRTAGIGDLYQGVLAHRLADSSAAAGGPITPADLRAALPRVSPAVVIEVARERIAVAPDAGGLATAASLQALMAGDVTGAGARGLAVATAVRSRGPDPALLVARDLGAVSLPALPASTTFATLDRDGNAVVCALSMNNLFGTGRVAPGTGILLAASPREFPSPLLAVAIAYNGNIHAFRAAAGGSGQAASPLAAALALQQELQEQRPDPAPDPGRSVLIGCARYLPGAEASCAWRVDPRGAGLAAGSS